MSLTEFDFGRDYFELFGISRGFNVDSRELDENYRTLQGIYHPDRYANKGPHERRLAVQASSWVNEGYQTLRDPARRARYLLELDGQSFNDERDTTADLEFLMRQMALREALEELNRAKGPMEDLDRLEEDLRNERSRVFDRFQTAYGSGELNEAKLMVMQMGFYARLIAEADRLAERLQESAT